MEQKCRKEAVVRVRIKMEKIKKGKLNFPLISRQIGEHFCKKCGKRKIKDILKLEKKQ